MPATIYNVVFELSLTTVIFSKVYYLLLVKGYNCYFNKI